MHAPLRESSVCRRLALSLLAVSLTSWIGCGGSNETNPEELAAEFRISDGSPAAGSIESAIVALTGTKDVEQLANDEQTKYEGNVEFVGRIGAGKQEPFAPGTAAFIVSEAPAGAHEQDPDHDPENCPFCKRRAEQGPIAYIRFEGADGKLLKHDARELFGVQKGHVVVIRGQGVYDEEKDMFTVAARGLQILNE